MMVEVLHGVEFNSLHIYEFIMCICGEKLVDIGSIAAILTVPCEKLTFTDPLIYFLK